MSSCLINAEMRSSALLAFRNLTSLAVLEPPRFAMHESLLFPEIPRLRASLAILSNEIAVTRQRVDDLGDLRVVLA